MIEIGTKKGQTRKTSRRAYSTSVGSVKKSKTFKRNQRLDVKGQVGGRSRTVEIYPQFGTFERKITGFKVSISSLGQGDWKSAAQYARLIQRASDKAKKLTKQYKGAKVV